MEKGSVNKVKPKKLTAGVAVWLFALISIFALAMSHLPVGSLDYWLFLEWFALLLPLLLVLKARGADLRGTLSLYTVKPPVLLGAAILSAVTMAFGVTLAYYQVPAGGERIGLSLEELLQEFNRPALFVGMALTPAVCEEILFRGLLLTALRGKISPVISVVLVACVFGVMHGISCRALNSFLAGLAMTYAAHRAGSVYPAMLMHLIQNGTVVGLGLYSIKHPLFPSVEMMFYRHQLPFLLGGAALLAAGIYFFERMMRTGNNTRRLRRPRKRS